MSRRTAIGFLIAGFCLVALFGSLGVSVYQRIRAFAVEDQIHGTFYPLARALYRYQDERGSPAPSLAALAPKYIATLPVSALADAPRYRVLADGQSWELTIRSSALPQTRLYVCRSTQHYTPVEEHRIILQYHALWTVFPADR